MHMEKLDRILCARCLRRQFGRKMKSKVPEIACQLCHGIFLRIPEIAAKAISELRAAGEVRTFQAGTTIPKSVEAFEERIWDEIDFSAGPAECIKAELNRELGKEIERTSRYRFDPLRPDARIVWDTRGIGIAVTLSPIFIYGRYRKLQRFIRQTRKAESVEESVEALIGDILTKEAGTGRAVLHSSGREDVDALMLGEGRPFIMELVAPKRRTLNLKKIGRKINSANRGKIEVLDLRWAAQGDIKVIKRAKFAKTYEALIETGRELTEEDIKALNAAAPLILLQRTPTRVLARRADITRKRKITAIAAKKADSRRARLQIDAQSGTYIKEFISGDEGRTSPSIAELLGTTAKCIELNVLKVHSEWYEDWW